jgi:hypothetical protein
MRIYVVAYPQIAKPGGSCAINVHLDSDEVTFTNQAIDYLDALVKAAASKAGVFYVDTEGAFYGHRFCEVGPGSVAINGVTAGNDIPKRLGGPIGSESFHPNAFGHELLENSILTLTHKLTAPMPNPDPNSGLPSTDDSAILDAPRSGRTVNLPEYDPGLVPDLAYAGTTIDLSAGSSEHSLPPGGNFNIELHSDPISLGSFTSDINGNISKQITIPTGIPTGYHTLHVYGADITGQSIDIYKDIYITKTADDLDGNGVDDSSQDCVGIEASGQDYDKDGVDDACDANISFSTTLPVSNATYLQGKIISTGITNTTNSNKTSDANIVNDSLISTVPRVLGDSTSTKSSQKNFAQTDDLYIKPKYYEAGGAGFFGLSLVSYFIKRRWF